jgi:hypothetical protein
MNDTVKIEGVTWLLIRNGAILLEQCPKKAAKMGVAVGEWFIPGGKCEGDETPLKAVKREIGEEWPTVSIISLTPLPIIQCSPVWTTPFLMQPYIVDVAGHIPSRASNGIPLKWTPLLEALLLSPIPQVRMMVAAANGGRR